LKTALDSHQLDASGTKTGLFLALSSRSIKRLYQ
jgi:hypothetical protein